MRWWVSLGAVFFCCVLAAPTVRAAGEDATAGEKLFALHVKPLLAQKCFACHGGDREKIEAGLNLTTR